MMLASQQDLDRAIQAELGKLGFHTRAASEDGRVREVLAWREEPSLRLRVVIENEARRPLPPLRIEQLLADRREPDETVILGVPAITRSRAGRLRDAGIGYIDAAGNASIDGPGVHILVDGRKHLHAHRPSPERTSGVSTRPTGLRVVFALLTIPEFLSARLADIAEAADVSVATTQQALTDLARRGLISSPRPPRVWLDERGAAELWLDSYLTRLVPRAEPKLFSAPAMSGNDWLEHICADDHTLAWLSGGMAIEARGGDIRAIDADVYIVPPLRRPPGNVRLGSPRPGEPTVRIRKAWWQPGTYPAGIAPSLLVYADALASGDPRIRTVATEFARGDDDLRRLIFA